MWTQKKIYEWHEHCPAKEEIPLILNCVIQTCSYYIYNK
jgi:hypothetical protein